MQVLACDSCSSEEVWQTKWRASGEKWRDEAKRRERDECSRPRRHPRDLDIMLNTKIANAPFICVQQGNRQLLSVREWLCEVAWWCTLALAGIRSGLTRDMALDSWRGGWGALHTSSSKSSIKVMMSQESRRIASSAWAFSSTLTHSTLTLLTEGVIQHNRLISSSSTHTQLQQSGPSCRITNCLSS